MKVNRLFLFIIIVITLIGCNTKPKKFIIEQEVINYLKNICKIEFPKKILIIFLTGYVSGCQPCEKGTIALVDSLPKLKNSNDYAKYVIISEDNKDSYKKLRSDKFTVISESKYAFQRHGIDYPYNFLIEFNNKYEIVYWELLVSSKFGEIYKNYQ